MRTKIPTTKLGLHYPNFNEKNQIVNNLYYVHVVIDWVEGPDSKIVGLRSWSMDRVQQGHDPNIILSGKTWLSQEVFNLLTIGHTTTLFHPFLFQLAYHIAASMAIHLFPALHVLAPWHTNSYTGIFLKMFFIETIGQGLRVPMVIIHLKWIHPMIIKHNTYRQ